MKIQKNDLFVFAMEDEAEYFFKQLSKKKKVLKNLSLFHCVYNEIPIYILISGVGMINTLYALCSASKKIKINNIYNIGICGAKGYNRMDVLEVDSVYNQDFDLTYFGYEPYQMSKDIKFLKACSNNLFKQTNLYTSSKFQIKPLDIKNSYIADMEGYAICYYAFKNNCNAYLYKMVSDEIGVTQKQDYQDFEKNCSMYIYERIIRELF